MRAIPSPVVSTVPVSLTKAPRSKFWICCLMICEISSALSCMMTFLLCCVADNAENWRCCQTGLPLQGRQQAVLVRGKPPLERAVDGVITDLRDYAGNQTRVHRALDRDLA